MPKILKIPPVVNYSGKDIPIDNFLEQIQAMPKEELCALMGQSKIISQVTNYIKSSSKVRKKYNLGATYK